MISCYAGHVVAVAHKGVHVVHTVLSPVLDKAGPVIQPYYHRALTLAREPLAKVWVQ